MNRIYILFRYNGGSPLIEHLGAFTHFTAARKAAQDIEGEMEWPEEHADQERWLAEPNPPSEWEAYGIDRLTITVGPA